MNEGIIFRFLTKPVTTKKFLFTLRAYVVQYHAARFEKEQLNELSFLAQTCGSLQLFPRAKRVR